MKTQNIHSLVAGPIEINGRYIGFYGVDNPPVDHLDSIANLIDIMDFVISMMIRLRDNSRTIKNMAVKDQLTNCKNRMALKWAYDNTYDKEKSIFVLMCDLKKVGMLLGYAYRNKSHERTVLEYFKRGGSQDVYGKAGILCIEESRGEAS